jgi:hypothetical protein
MKVGEQKVLEHLKMIGAVIDRMNRSSNTIKGFCIPTFSAVLVYGLREHCIEIQVFLIVLVLVFAIIDMYYLWQERLFQRLYKATIHRVTTDYSMDKTRYKREVSKLSLLRSPSICLLYGPLLAVAFAGVLIVGGYL